MSAPLTAITKTQAWHLHAYVVDHAADHDDDCPQDDTCDCSFKARNDAVSAVVQALIEQTASGVVTVTLTRKELRRLEWAADALCEGEETCPSCHAGRHSDCRHNAGCWIAAALARETETPTQ